MKHDGCELCKYEREPADSKHCLGCEKNATDKYVRMTNADRIRRMTDKELAVAILEIAYDEKKFSHCSDLKTCEEILKDEMFIPEIMCARCMLFWLQQEVEEEHE